MRSTAADASAAIAMPPKTLPYTPTVSIGGGMVAPSPPSLTPVILAMPAATRCENAVARNHAPMIVLTTRTGASLVTSDSPTGERQSSPVVCSR